MRFSRHQKLEEDMYVIICDHHKPLTDRSLLRNHIHTQTSAHTLHTHHCAQPRKLFHVRYTDGDEEDLYLEELRPWVLSSRQSRIEELISKHDQHAAEIADIFRQPSNPSASSCRRAKRLSDMNVYLVNQLTKLSENVIDLTFKRSPVANSTLFLFSIPWKYVMLSLGLRDLPALLNTCSRAREIVRQHSRAYSTLDFHRIVPKERFALVVHVVALRPVHVYSVRLTVGYKEVGVASTLLQAVGSKLRRLSISHYNMCHYPKCYPRDSNNG